ncbi:hypothetical protein OG426_04275 [Streptomyces canus]|uniref:hypothetical protein n=1 Tax=Streptomyces canus TaxID=58343 RepID=UPI00386F18FB|nr:hypothetical protein OG426_04275 [Streptomyces canus]
MKAAVLTAPERIARIDVWAEPFCGPGDVVVETHGVGLCGTDLAMVHGKRHAPALRPAVDRAVPGATVVLRGSMIHDHSGDFSAAMTELPAARFPLARAQAAGAAGRAGKTWLDLGSEYA